MFDSQEVWTDIYEKRNLWNLSLSLMGLSLFQYSYWYVTSSGLIESKNDSTGSVFIVVWLVFLLNETDHIEFIVNVKIFFTKPKGLTFVTIELLFVM